jgi:D-beta-D-heptose 7-phosphate kinase/D-beta-D-heptose 1-phosphate adenosyltransferase
MLIPIEEIEQFCNQLRNEGKSIVFTNGCFDILHVGHTTYLQKAKDLGDVLILGLNSDASVRRLKGESRPINNENDRATVLLALRSIDHVVIFPEDTPFNLISLIQPDILAKGGDYSRDTIVGADIVEARGGKVVVIPLVDGKSTTATINKMQTNC